MLEQWVRHPRAGALGVACGAGRNALYHQPRTASPWTRSAFPAKHWPSRAPIAQRTGLRVNWIEHDLDEPLADDRLCAR